MDMNMLFVNPSLLRFIFPWIMWRGSRDSNEIFLTFDDGPHPVHTPFLLDILKEHEIRAAFFLNGLNMLEYPDIVRRINQEQHTIGNHGYSHRKGWFQKTRIILEEIHRSEAALKEIIGYKSLWFRPPYGQFDCRFRRILDKLNYRMVLWSLLSYDFRETDRSRLIRRVLSHLHPGAILVFHDSHPHTPILLDALPEMIQKIMDMGYRFGNLDSLPEKRENI
jgi:peptidoglycan/xylan/chitin deacetylase (PgdA/CDA1 family)